MDSPDTWQWIWLVTAVALAIGEMSTAGSFFLLPFVEDTQEEQPGEFGDVLHGPGHIRPAHDIADGLDRAVDRLLGGEIVVAVFADFCHIQNSNDHPY